MKTSIFGRTIYAASVTDVGCVGVKEGLANTAEFYSGCPVELHVRPLERDHLRHGLCRHIYPQQAQNKVREIKRERGKGEE